MFKFKVKIEKNEDEILALLEKDLDKKLNDMADKIAYLSDKYLREGHDGTGGTFDTGFLANSQVNDKSKKLHKEVGYEANYAPYIEYGTRPHHPPIKPIYDWVYRKRGELGIQITSHKNVKLKDGNTYNVSLLQVTMAIIKNIEKYGTEEHPYLRPAFYEVTNGYK